METETISVKENPCPCYGGIVQTLTLDSRPRQLPMKVRSCGSQPANISLINRREGVSVSAHARVRKRRDGKKHSGLINPASAEAHHISRFFFQEHAGKLWLDFSMPERIVNVRDRKIEAQQAIVRVRVHERHNGFARFNIAVDL